MDPVALDADRPMWLNAKVFILAVVGAGAGFGGFFRLPYMFHRFGGGPFLIAYCLMLLLAAWPLALVELLIGQHFRKGAIGAWEQVNSSLSGLGYSATIFCTSIISLYYSSVLTWTVRPYLIGCGMSPMEFEPYTDSAMSMRRYFQEQALFNNIETNWPLLVTLIGLWLIVFMMILRGVHSFSIAAYVIVPLPLIGALSMAIYSVTVPGAGETLREQMTPHGIGDFLRFDLWAHALGQALLTMQAASGVLIAFGSYARPVHNCVRISVGSMLLALVCSGIFAVLAGASFAGLSGGFSSSTGTESPVGWNSTTTTIPVPFPTNAALPPTSTPIPLWDGSTSAPAGAAGLSGSQSFMDSASSVPPTTLVPTATGAPSLLTTQSPRLPTPAPFPTQFTLPKLFLQESGLYISLIVYPLIFRTMSWGNGWGVIFFLCILLLGLQTLSATVSAVFTVLKDRFAYKHNALLLAFMCTVGCGIGMVLTLRGGYPYLMALDTAVISIILPLFAFIEALGVGYLWSERSIAEVASERGGSGCLGKTKVLLVVAYQHSVGKIQELLELQGRTFALGRRVLPIVIKFVVLVLAFFCFIAGYIEAFRQPSAMEIVVVAVLPILALFLVLIVGCCKKKRKSVNPLTDDDLVLATTTDPNGSLAESVGGTTPQPLQSRSTPQQSSLSNEFSSRGIPKPGSAAVTGGGAQVTSSASSSLINGVGGPSAYVVAAEIET
jgi:SNF family Na+-dependent transporter